MEQCKTLSHEDHRKQQLKVELERRRGLKQPLLFGLDERAEQEVFSRLPISSLMTARAVSKTWNSRLAIFTPEVDARLLLVQASNNRLVAFDTRHHTWATMPPGCVPCHHSRLVSAHGGLACFRRSCRGVNLTVGSPLTGSWTDLANAPFDDYYTPVLSTSQPGSFLVLSYGRMSNFRFTSTRGLWTKWPRVISPCITRLPRLLISGDFLYALEFPEDDMHHLRVVEYSLLTQLSTTKRYAWGQEISPQGLSSTLVKCGGVMYIIGFVESAFEEPPYTLGIWRLVESKSEWELESTYDDKVMTSGGQGQLEIGFCCDGVDTIWVLVVGESVEKKTMSYSLTSKEWSVYPPCPFGPLAEYAECFIVPVADAFEYWPLCPRCC